jgi:cation transporter-like permease
MLRQEITLTETRTLYAILAARLSTAINLSNLEAVRRQKTANEQDLWKLQIAGFTSGCLPAAYLPTATSFRTEEEEGIASRALLHNQLHHDLVSSPFFYSRQSRKLPRE